MAGARTLGMPSFDSWNGAMMETSTGAGNSDTIAQQEGRQSIYRDYVHPWADRPNLTVLTHALVTRVLLERGRAVGVELERDGMTTRVGAASQVVLSLGAINTPKVLMQSGIGDAEQLRRFGIDVAQHLPAVGRNLQDHPLTLAGVWESPVPVPDAPVARAGAYVATDAAMAGPNIQLQQWEGALTSVTDARVQAPSNSWVVYSGLVRPASRGSVVLTGSHPSDPVHIDGGYLSDPRDVEALVSAVEVCRDLAASTPLRPHVAHEVFPLLTGRSDLEHLIRTTATSFWHQSGTCAMGHEESSVVDGRLGVHGVQGLRIADASVMPRITTGNTMAPCVIIGERASGMLRADLGLA